MDSAASVFHRLRYESDHGLFAQTIATAAATTRMIPALASLCMKSVSGRMRRSPDPLPGSPADACG